MTEKLSPLTSSEVDAFHKDLSNWNRFGANDQMGTLNFIQNQKRVSAAASVQSGRAVSCARSLETRPGVDNPIPVQHHMIGTATEGWGGDYFGLAPHGFATSHIDALCHIFHKGKIYNGYSIETVTAHGALQLGIHALRHGIISRGILIDIPRVRNVSFLEAGDSICVSDLEQAEENAGLVVEPGDVLLVRTGRWKLREIRGPWNPAERLAGLDARCLPWLHDRGVAALGSDGASDVIPSRIEGYELPIHSVAIVAMGLHLLDNLDLEMLSEACVEEGRWNFLLTVAPLILHRGTASPVNPVALF